MTGAQPGSARARLASVEAVVNRQYYLSVAYPLWCSGGRGRPQRKVAVDGFDHLWVAEITNVAIYLFLTVVFDTWTRRVSGLGRGRPPAHGAGVRLPEHGDRPALPVQPRLWLSHAVAHRADAVSRKPAMAKHQRTSSHGIRRPSTVYSSTD